MKNSLLLLCWFGVIQCGLSQQDAMFTRYTFISNMMYNPASVGRVDGLTMSLAYRNQWAKIEGAPTTINLNIDAPISGRTAGLGLNIIRDNIGLDQHTAAYANYAYRIPINNKYTLSLGIKGGLSHIQTDYTKAITPNPSLSDPIHNLSQGVVIPKVGLGLFIASERSYLGFSVPTLIASIPDKTLTLQQDAAFLSHHFYLTSGRVFDVPDSDVQVKPSIFIKYHPTAPLQVDINVMAWYKDVFAFGLSYRTEDAISGIIDLGVYKGLVLSYAYDYTYSDFSRIANGAHEVILLYTFTKKDIKVPSIHKFSNLSRF